MIWRTLLLLLIVLIDAIRGHFFSSRAATSRQSQCQNSGGSCEPMFGCLFNQGHMSGACGGFLQVCCIQPSLQSRRFKENSIFGSGPPPTSVDFGPVVNDPTCGRPPNANRRVLDGEPAGFGSFPWQALIRVGKGKCGGVLVNRRHVVTAGHCVKNKVLSSVIVTLGEYHLKSSREPLPDQTFRVIKAVVHPRFQFSPAADRFDVAVLRLDRPVRYAPHIAPISLPEVGRDPAPGTQAYVAGWGALIPEDVTGPLISILVPEVKRPSVLQVVNVPVITNEKCERWHNDQGIQVQIWPEMVCAGYREGGKDSCKGDSGGPLMVQQADGRWVLIGIVSAGFSCGKPGQPGIYHRISGTSDWISFYTNNRDLHHGYHR